MLRTFLQKYKADKRLSFTRSSHCHFFPLLHVFSPPLPHFLLSLPLCLQRMLLCSSQCEAPADVQGGRLCEWVSASFITLLYNSPPWLLIMLNYFAMYFVLIVVIYWGNKEMSHFAASYVLCDIFPLGEQLKLKRCLFKGPWCLIMWTVTTVLNILYVFWNFASRTLLRFWACCSPTYSQIHWFWFFVWWNEWHTDWCHNVGE